MSDWGREKGFEFEFFDGLVLPFLGLYLSHFDLSFRGIEYQNRMCDGPLESLAFFSEHVARMFLFPGERPVNRTRVSDPR